MDVMQFETETLGKRGLLKQIPSRYRTTYFNHTMGGGYTAGYYSYIWAEVLVVDADPQANASSGLGVDLKEIDCSIYECLINQTDIREAIYTTDIDGLDIIPSHIDLVGAEIEMLNLENREKIMKKGIRADEK